LSGMLFAQKVKVGIVNRDSVLASIPGANAVKDTLSAHKLTVAKTHNRLEDELSKKIREADSLKAKSSPLIQRLRQIQIQDITSTLAQYDYLAAEELKIDSLKLVPFTYAIEQAEMKMAEKYRCSIETEYKNDNREPIYLTNEVIGLLKENKQAQTSRKQIGYVNKDSLLSALYPDYKESKATFENDVRLLRDSAEQMQREYERKQLEMDSMRGNSSPLQMQLKQKELDTLDKYYAKWLDEATSRVAIRDSIVCVPYNAKYDKAWTDMMKQGEIFYIYDSKDAMLAWKAEEADLINLNRDFATKLN
jgi:Skp family chaperone for outer membrane proteins